MRDITLEDTFDLKFTTRRFTTGVPFALASGTISAYPGNSVTQITAGITLSADFDGVTGLNNVRVVATAANGYAASTDYALVITAGTVDSVSVVGEVIGEFSIGRSAAAVDLANASDGLTAAKAVIDAILVDTGTTLDGRIPAALTANGNMKSSMVEILTTALTETAGLLAGGFKKFFNVVTPTGTVNSIPDAVAGAAGGLFIAGSNAATTANITGNLTGNVTGSVGSVTGAVGSVTGAVGSVTGLTASDVGAIKTKTDSLTFTQAGHVDANVQRINDVSIVGDGSATPFNV